MLRWLQRRRRDLCSLLFQLGKTIPKPKFEFMRADGDGKPIRYFEIELENVLIGRCKPGIQPGIGMTENLCLTFFKVKWKYTQQKIGGGIGGIRLHRERPGGLEMG
jgi:type VI protein secretion system component Hcp